MKHISLSLYEKALIFARRNEYAIARKYFQESISAYPNNVIIWISYAQMEKRYGSMPKCRAILRNGIHLNPNSSRLHIALGLHEMQRGNKNLGLEILRRAVELDPTNEAVLKWKNHIE
jgi:tetratricopeptide (TPR) repeat protein